MASEKSTVKRPFSESSSVTSPEYKRPNINISSDDIDAELAEIENLLLESSPSPTTFIDKNYENLIKDTILSELMATLINILIKKEVKTLMSQYEERISFLTGCVDSLTTMVTELRNEVDRQQQHSPVVHPSV